MRSAQTSAKTRSYTTEINPDTFNRIILRYLKFNWTHRFPTFTFEINITDASRNFDHFDRFLFKQFR